MKISAPFFYVGLSIGLASPATADGIQISVSSIPIRPSSTSSFTMGSTIDIARIDINAKHVDVEGTLRLIAQKRDFEKLLQDQINSALPQALKGGIKITSVENVSVVPADRDISFDADFHTSPIDGKRHISLKIENRLLDWAVAATIVKIVPHSVQLRFSDDRLIDAFENTVANTVLNLSGQGQIGFVTETAVQEAIDRVIDQKRIRAYIPQVTNIRNIRFGFSKITQRVWIVTYVSATFDKKGINNQIQAFVNDLGPSMEGRSAFSPTHREERVTGGEVSQTGVKPVEFVPASR